MSAALPKTTFTTLAETINRIVAAGMVDRARKDMRWSTSQADYAEQRLREAATTLHALAQHEGEVRAIAEGRAPERGLV